MTRTSEKIKEIQQILQQGRSPIFEFLNNGLPRDIVKHQLEANGISPNEDLMILYEWHNGVRSLNNVKFTKIQIWPEATFYSLDFALQRRNEIGDWNMLDSYENYLPFIGGLEDDMFLIKNDSMGQVFQLSPSANIYGDFAFRSISDMLDLIIDCFVEGIFWTDPNEGLRYDLDGYFKKKKVYSGRNNSL
jgi:hypothetical protein